MSFEFPVISDELRKNLDEMVRYMHANAGQRDNDTTHMAFDQMMFSRGVSLNVVSFDFPIPYGVTPRKYRQEIIAAIRENVFPKHGLRMMSIDSLSAFGHTQTHIAVLVKMRTSATIVTISFRTFTGMHTVLMDSLKEVVETNTVSIAHRLVINTHNKEITSREIILPPMAKPNSFRTLYPYLNEDPATLWNDFVKSKSNVMLLIGPPGLGKSSIIRAMVDHRGWSDDVYVADRQDVLAHPGLSDFIRGMDRGSLLIAEDADNMVSKREDGNSGMSALLNTASGIIPSDVKIIITTNLPNLKKVDEALLRPGRMFRVLEFKRLTVKQAHAARETMGLEEVDFGDMSEITLAEALNWHEVNGVINTPTRIGFV